MKRFFFSNLMMAVTLVALAWGQKGHDVTAAVANNHLTPATRQAVEQLLDNKSIIYWSNWLDNASHTPEYAYTKTWHYKNVDEGVRYEEAPANPAGDAVTALKQQIEILSDPASKDADKALALKIMIHVMGDLHMPLHMGHATDLGGNRIKIKYIGRDVNLHSAWDSTLPENAHKWSYTEWREQIDRVTPEEIESICSGSIDDWAKETVAIASQVYRYFERDPNLSYDQTAYWAPTVELQFLRGGLRLASVLNSLFDPTAGK